jgi:phage tail sheath protein FI
MATTYYTPGVYIEEVDKGTKPIQGVSTSVAAFIGFTAKAEKTTENGITTKSILGEPTLVTNWGQYERMFGSYHKDAYLPYAVRGFFDNGGTRCYVISIRAMDAHRAQTLVYGKDERTERKTPVLFVRAATSGKDGDALSVSIQAIDQENGSPAATQTPQQQRFRLTVQGAQTAPQAATAQPSADEKKLADLRQKVNDLKAQHEQAGREVARLQKEQPKAQTPEDQEKLKKDLEEANKKQASLKEAQEQAQKELSDLESAAAKQAPSNKVASDQLEFTLDSLPFMGDEQAERRKWHAYRREHNGNGSGKGSTNGDAKPLPAGSFIDQRKRGLAVEVWKLNKLGPEASILPSVDTVEPLRGGTWQVDTDLLKAMGAAEVMGEITQETDQSSLVVKNSSLLYRGGEPQRKGIDGLFAFDDVNLVCAPDLMKVYDMVDNREEADTLVKGVQETILTYCTRAHYPFAILDSPPDRDVQEIAEWRMGLPGADTPHGALYYPWIKITDPMDAKKQIAIPPSGHVAGIYARSDNQRGVHKAPANELVGGAVALPLNVTKNEQELLNPIGVNCIRAFPGRGIRIWGARTLAMTDPSWRYINVRRLFSYVEASVERSTQWVVFEPNDHVLWAKVRRDVSAFLRTVWLSGALFGLTPEEAFYVKCDEETNLPELRDLGQMVCEIGLAPVKPAEFVIFRFSQWTSDADTAG